MTKLQFTLPEPTILLNEWQRMHWRVRRRHMTSLAWLVRVALGQSGRTPMKRCRVEIERHSAGLPDWDGLYGGLKPLMDCLVVPTRTNPHGLGVIADDNPNCVLSLVARPLPAKRGEGKTVVRITEAA